MMDSQLRILEYGIEFRMFSHSSIFCILKCLVRIQMLIRWLALLGYQVLLLCLLLTIPVVWLLGVGGFPYLELAYSLSVYELMVALLNSRQDEIMRYTGLALIMSSSIYLRLPFPLLPMYVPLLGRLDKLVALVFTIAGIVLVLVSIVL